MWPGRKRDWSHEVLSNVIDSFGTFATMPATSYFRLLGAIIVRKLDMDLCNFDDEQALVQSSLEEDVFMGPLPGCSEMPAKVVRLNRSLYGLKQAPRWWHNFLLAQMKSLGFEQNPDDECVMRVIESGSVSMVTVCIHADDIVAAGLKARCDQFCEDLNRCVPVTAI